MALDAYHIDSVNTCYDETAVKCFLAVKKEKKRTNSEHSHCDCRPRNSNGNETGRDATRRASLPCARVKTVKHSKLHIRFSDAHLNTKTVDGYSG